MNYKQPPSDSDIERASATWLACQAVGDAPDDWVEHLEEDWRRDGDYAAMWRFVLKLCQDVADDDSETIGMIGAGPLHDTIHTWPDKALKSIEAAVNGNPKLLQALAIILPHTQSIGERIDAILARHGQERQ